MILILFLDIKYCMVRFEFDFVLYLGRIDNNYVVKFR